MPITSKENLKKYIELNIRFIRNLRQEKFEILNQIKSSKSIILNHKKAIQVNEDTIIRLEYVLEDALRVFKEDRQLLKNIEYLEKNLSK